MKIAREAEQVAEKRYRRVFKPRQPGGVQYAFACDKDGNVNVDKLHTGARINFRWCVDGTRDVFDSGVEVTEITHKLPAVGLCDCGRQVELEGFTNTCECGADYNWAGQRLAPREQWGEETGEHWTDILRIR